MTNPLFDNVVSRTQSARYKSVLKEVRQFRAYCCNIDAAGIMGVSKEPGERFFRGISGIKKSRKALLFEFIEVGYSTS